MRTLLQLLLLLASAGAWASPGLPYFAKTRTVAGVTPSDVSGLYYWWVGDDTTNYTIVTNWIDRIRSAPQTQATASARPTSSADGVYFDGSQYLTFTNLSTGPGQLFSGQTNVFGIFILKPITPLSTYGMIVGSSANEARGLSFNPGHQYQYWGAAASWGPVGTWASGTNIDICVQFWATNVSAKGMNFYTNGVICVTNIAEVGQNYNWTAAIGNAGDPFYWKGYIHEMLWYTNKLSPSDIALIHQYATNRYKYSP